MEQAIEAGAEDVVEEETRLSRSSPLPEDFTRVSEHLAGRVSSLSRPPLP